MNQLRSIGIVADDLTGAGDSAVKFARTGWHTTLTLSGVGSVPGPHPPEVATDPPAEEARSATAIVTDARPMGATAATASTSRAVAELRSAGIERLFLKIDSTGRGSLESQIRGALTAWRPADDSAVAVVCPAYPSLGRTLENGLILVHGVGVQSTAARHDPVTPVLSARIIDLIPGSANLDIQGGDAAHLATRINESVRAGFCIVTVNARTDGELDVIAAATELLGPAAIPVGSAGLAGALASLWAGSPQPALPVSLTLAVDSWPASKTHRRMTVVVSSLHEVSRGQCRHLIEHAPAGTVRVLEPGIADLLDARTVAAWLATNLGNALGASTVDLIVSPAIRGTDQTSASLVRQGLAQITQAVMGQTSYRHAGDAALVLVGGEGAGAVLLRLGASAIVVTGSLQEGIPVGVASGGILDGVTVVTKSGGFGQPGALTDLLPQLLASSAPELPNDSNPKGARP